MCRFFIAVFAVILLIALPGEPTHAIDFGVDSIVTPTANSANIDTAQNLPTLIGQLIRAALGLLGIFFLILTVYAGFLWATAAGSDENIKKAKKLLVNGVIGMVLMLSSYAITTFVLGLLTDSPVL
ncbi:MAG: hypothetical protein O3B64_02400 [bacterium]|nr:hypothetical protein [bacterium]MDA1024349.1 hypothetical protein [bacterium]